MSLLTENIIPGEDGKVFATDAKKTRHLTTILTKLMELKGIKNVHIDFEILPREFTIHTSKLIPITEIQKIPIKMGFHMIPKGSFES
ncbi:MAG: heavy-metal-associated domain-containing protein [Flavobacteriaceae bacterium]|tara:strand:+ start:7686 stop:7946 length:261 start_codon:yes stop_codon:yes gene_type:complete